jgi:hypothetical protein
MVERWNNGFQKDNSHFNFIINSAGGGTINPTLHYPRTHYSIIPLFHHSNCERSELTCLGFRCQCSARPGAIWRILTVRSKRSQYFPYLPDSYNVRSGPGVSGRRVATSWNLVKNYIIYYKNVVFFWLNWPFFRPAAALVWNNIWRMRKSEFGKWKDGVASLCFF